MSPSVVVLDLGAGDVGPVTRALQRAGATVEAVAGRGAGGAGGAGGAAERVEVVAAAEAADGLVVPGRGAFAALAARLRAVRGDRVVGRRLAGGRPVLAIGAGMQVMFERSAEPGQEGEPGLGEWPGVVEPLPPDAAPHSGWAAVEPPGDTVLLAGVEGERFAFAHSGAVQRWEFSERSGEVGRMVPPAVAWAEHGVRFVAAVENGPLAATLFHPEDSGDAGAHLLETWVRSL